MATEDQYNPLVQDQKYLNEVKYAARDFVSMADDLLRRLKIEYGDVYNDYAATSQGIMLRDLVAWAYAALIWYLDRTASDCYLETARTRMAVERIVEQIAYKMRPAAASGTTLTLTFPEGTTSGFIMEDRWKYLGPDGLLFESFARVIQPTALSAGETLSVDVRQGESRTLTYTSDGSKNQTYRLTNVDEDRYLATGATEVWVDGSLWEEKDFLEFEKTNHCEVSYFANPPIVRFGDGLAGNIPPSSAEIKIRFLIIDGEKGNVRANTIESSVDTLSILGTPVAFDVTNESRSVGGTDPETAESAKKLAPSSFAARGAVITQGDYEALAGTFTDATYGSVAKVYAYNPRSSYSDLVFNSLISDIENLLSVFVSEVEAVEQSVAVDSASLTVALSVIDSANTALEALRLSISTWSQSAAAATTSAREGCSEAQARGSVSADYCSEAETLTNSLIVYIRNGNTDTNYIKDELEVIKSTVVSAKNESNGVVSAAGSAVSFIDSGVTPNLDNITAATADGGEMDLYIETLVEQYGIVSGLVVSIQADLASLSGISNTLSSDIQAVLDLMHARIGELFSEDCLSNYVQVPVLSTDLDGNYTSPSIGLRAALQRYLNDAKEVTQVVEVVDGSPVLVPAEIEIRMSILDSYVPSEVKSKVESVVVGLLKGRDFDSPLYLSDLYDVVNGASAGIDYVNISIVGPILIPSVIDAKGNLVTAENQVIVYGSLSVTGPNGEAI